MNKRASSHWKLWIIYLSPLNLVYHNALLANLNARSYLREKTAFDKAISFTPSSSRSLSRPHFNDVRPPMSPLSLMWKSCRCSTQVVHLRQQSSYIDTRSVEGDREREGKARDEVIGWFFLIALMPRHRTGYCFDCFFWFDSLHNVKRPSCYCY